MHRSEPLRERPSAYVCDGKCQITRCLRKLGQNSHSSVSNTSKIRYRQPCIPFRLRYLVYRTRRAFLPQGTCPRHRGSLTWAVIGRSPHWRDGRSARGRIRSLSVSLDCRGRAHEVVLGVTVLRMMQTWQLVSLYYRPRHKRLGKTISSRDFGVALVRFSSGSLRRPIKSSH